MGFQVSIAMKLETVFVVIRGVVMKPTLNNVMDGPGIIGIKCSGERYVSNGTHTKTGPGCLERR